MFRLNQGSPLLLFQIKSVETRLPCCVVHWSGAAGDIWPTGPMLTLSDLRMSTVFNVNFLIVDYFYLRIRYLMKITLFDDFDM